MTAGYILSGGQNRRMDGRKKLFLSYQGEPFYKHILRAFSIFPVVYLSVDTPEPYADLNLPMVLDSYTDIGPMGGIYSGLKSCPESSLFVAACDMPFFNQEDICRVLEAYHTAQRITIVREKDRIHPLFGIYPKTVLPLLEQMILEKNYRMRDLFQLTTPEFVTLSHHQAVWNINTSEQYTNLKSVQQREEGNLCMDRPAVSKTPFVFSIRGFKNSGKTTLITQLIPELKKRGYQVAVIKHDGHDFESDVPGTDSYRHQKAGAYGTAVFSKYRILITKEYDEANLEDLIPAFPEADIILIEGLKNSNYPHYTCEYPNCMPITATALADKIEQGLLSR